MDPMILMLIGYVALFYFIFFLPQQKRKKKEKEMLSGLKVTDEILTSSGIYGKIVNIKDDVLTIEVGADKVKLKIARWAVMKVETSA